MLSCAAPVFVVIVICVIIDVEFASSTRLPILRRVIRTLDLGCLLSEYKTIGKKLKTAKHILVLASNIRQRVNTKGLDCWFVLLNQFLYIFKNFSIVWIGQESCCFLRVGIIGSSPFLWKFSMDS